MLKINGEKVVAITDSLGHIYYDSDHEDLGLSDYGITLPNGTSIIWYSHRPNLGTLELINPAHVVSIRLLSIIERKETLCQK